MENLSDKDYASLVEALISKPDSVAVVKFSATWCGPCKALAPIYERIAEAEKDVPLHAVDIDVSPAATESLDIRGVPTIVFFKGGKEVYRSVGLIKEADLKEKIASLKGEGGLSQRKISRVP